MRDITIMTLLVSEMPEEERIAFMDKFKAASQAAEEHIKTEELPIILSDPDKVASVLAHLEDQVAGQ